jgi:glycosyltransferase involved in cell wall biosynthesis
MGDSNGFIVEGGVRIASVSTDYPGPRNPARGVFLKRRLEALSRIEEIHVIHLQPWFPLLRPRPVADWQGGAREQPPALRPGMFYLPGILKGLDSYWVKRAVVPAVGALEREGPVDLIDAHFGYPEGVGCVKAGLKLGKPVFVTLRGLERQVLGYRWRSAQLVWALRRSTGLICVSRSLADLALAHGVSPEKVRVIPNAVDRKRFAPGDRAEARRFLGIEEKGRLLLAVGMLVHGKGQHLLVEAFARLRAKHPDLRLALVGGAAHEPKYPEKIRKMVEGLGLGDAVLLPGPQAPDRVAAWLRAADLFALPTYDEGCCNAILEAMACGLPVVTTPVGDNADLVDPPQRGLLVPPDNVPALADALESALGMSWDRNAIARYGADYTWDEVARQTACFFRERLD